jgi:2-amino-4-hydroxy-6-hydroxymethyldihydropteridine diphosphokinase
LKIKKAVISLGSNLGNRLELLQKTLVLLEQNNIKVTALSSLYETPAWGFDSEPFYNACVQIETDFSPQELLSLFLEIEEQLGRIRQQSDEYTARQIDLDLLFYENLILNTDELELPHPRLHLRNFVLVPLKEIVPKWQHPVLNLTVTELLGQCSDQDELEKLPFHKWSPHIFDAFPFIIIEGNIGVGKTTLAQKMATLYKLPLLKEAFTKNPYLEKFYTDPETYALDVETYFFKDRINQTQLFWKQNKTKAVSDYSILKSLIFARQNLNSADFKDYQNRFSENLHTQKLPNLMVYLHTDIDILQEQIKKRGRPYEQKIKNQYLEQIEKGYQDIIQSDLPYPVVSISTKNFDFETNEADFQSLLRFIYRASFS